jgi:hypothetical protein
MSIQNEIFNLKNPLDQDGVMISEFINKVKDYLDENYGETHPRRKVPTHVLIEFYRDIKEDFPYFSTKIIFRYLVTFFTSDIYLYDNFLPCSIRKELGLDTKNCYTDNFYRELKYCYEQGYFGTNYRKNYTYRNKYIYFSEDYTNRNKKGNFYFIKIPDIPRSGQLKLQEARILRDDIIKNFT